MAQEEIFDPVLSVMTFRTPEEAFERANNTPYGFERRRVDGQGQQDFQDGQQAARRSDLFFPDNPHPVCDHPLPFRGRGTGIVWANTYNKFDPTSPFGSY